MKKIFLILFVAGIGFAGCSTSKEGSTETDSLMTDSMPASNGTMGTDTANAQPTEPMMDSTKTGVMDTTKKMP